MQAPIVDTVPEHVAIIMDGNRRWARERGVPIAQGYRRGIEALRAAVRAAISSGVSRLTVYGFSTENWQREPSEVGLLMHLYAAAAQGERSQLVAQGVRVEIIGELEAFAAPARAALRNLVRATVHNRRLTLTLALNYSGRGEIIRAVKSLARDVAAGALSPEGIDEPALRAKLYAPDAPDPGLLIRTGAEQRVSNFLLYQLAYTEFVTLPLMWPDFDESAFMQAIGEFTERQRRYGV